MAIFPKNRKNPDEMTFLDHIEELRWHIIRSVIGIGGITIFMFIRKDFVFDTVIFGPMNDRFLTYRFLCWVSRKTGFEESFCVQAPDITFVNLELAGQFLIHLKMAALLGFVCAFPYVFWEFWRFIKPALYEKELKYARGVVLVSSLLFLTGVSFGYFVMMPFSLSFFASYNVSETVENTFAISNYTGFLTMFILSSGLIFELPIVVYFLTKIGLVTPQFMRQYRRHSAVAIMVVSALITPADVGTQVLVALPLFLLYEISIFISAYVVNKQEQELQ